MWNVNYSKSSDFDTSPFYNAPFTSRVNARRPAAIWLMSFEIWGALSIFSMSSHYLTHICSRKNLIVLQAFQRVSFIKKNALTSYAHCGLSILWGTEESRRLPISKGTHSWRRPLFPGEKGKYINVFCFPGLFPTGKGREMASEMPNIANPIYFPRLYPREKDKAAGKYLFNYLFPLEKGVSVHL